MDNGWDCSLIRRGSLSIDSPWRILSTLDLFNWFDPRDQSLSKTDYRWRIGENPSLPLGIFMARISTNWCLKRSLSDVTRQLISNEKSLSIHRSTTEWSVRVMLIKSNWTDDGRWGWEELIEIERTHSDKRYYPGRWSDAWECPELGACVRSMLDEVVFRIDNFVPSFVDESFDFSSMRNIWLMIFSQVIQRNIEC